MSISCKFPREIKNSLESFSKLIDICAFLKKISFENVDLDFSETSFFEANISSLLGAVIDDLDIFVLVDFKNLQPQVQSILQKNDFLSNYGFPKKSDYYDTTIKYNKFKASDNQAFYSYIDSELLTKHDFPNLSTGFKRAFMVSLLEIFANPLTHAGCNFVYTCGQYFPRKKDLYFTIVNTGKTIKENVCEFLGNYNYGATNAIAWAIEKNNTTKRNVPGGLGFDTVRKFIKKNKGALQVISDSGFWEQNIYGKIKTKEFKNSFSGTIVNLKIKMDDNQSYCVEEDDIEEIFN